MDPSSLPDLQPTLAGDRVHLRPLREADWAALLAVASDPLIWTQHPEPERCEPAVFRRFFDSGLASGGALLVTDAHSGEVIGSSRYHGHDPLASDLEIGWTFLARSHWGGLHNGEMKRLMLAHAFRWVESTWFAVAPGNLRSQHAMLKIGAVCEGPRFVRDRDYLVYRIRRQDFGTGATTSRAA
jgi:RimJ/RimL family protein N-acetyltransferase